MVLYVFYGDNCFQKQNFTKNLYLACNIFIFTLYIGTFVLFKDYGWGNKINALSYFLLVSIIIKFAFSYPISEKLIRKK